MNKKETWLAQLVTLAALTGYLQEKGWTVEERRLVNVFAYPEQNFDDGEPITLVLPVTQRWDWTFYRETAIGLLAASEGRDATQIIYKMLDLTPDIDIPGLLAQFDAANPPSDSVPF